MEADGDDDWHTEDEESGGDEIDDSTAAAAVISDPADEFSGSIVLPPVVAGVYLASCDHQHPHPPFVIRSAATAANDILVTMTKRGAPPPATETRLRLEAEESRRELAAVLAAGSAGAHPPIPMLPPCSVCISAPADCVALACGHVYACTTCCVSLTTCPVCRATTSFTKLRF